MQFAYYGIRRYSFYVTHSLHTLMHNCVILYCIQHNSITLLDLVSCVVLLCATNLRSGQLWALSLHYDHNTKDNMSLMYNFHWFVKMMGVIVDRKIKHLTDYYDCTGGEVVVSTGDEEAITCTDIGELLSLCHQYCVTRWSTTRFKVCWWCASESTSAAAEENWLVHTNRKERLESILTINC